MERLHVVDGHGYIFRAHYGLMNVSRGERREVRLSTAEGMPTGALYVFIRMLMRLHDDVRPDRIAVVFDAGRKSFRTEIYPAYKATRPPPPEEIALQMPFFRPLVEAMGWPVLAVEGVEADDVVATLTARARARGWEVIIYSADKDLMQLVGDGVAMIDAMRQHTYTREAVLDKFGVAPERVADFLALKGDSSDNIPGVSGVGDKTAAELVNAYPDIEALIAANPRVRGKYPLADPEAVERLRVSRRLVELDRDVTLPVELDGLHASAWNTAELTRLFTDLEFTAMLDRVAATPAPAMPTAAAAPAAGPVPTLAEPLVVTTPEQLVPVLGAVLAARRCAVAVETAGRFDRATVVGVAIAPPGHPPAYVPVGHRSLAAGPSLAADELTPLATVLADVLIAKVVHDAKGATRALAEHGWVLAGVDEDPMLAAFLLDATSDPTAAETVAAQVTGVELIKRTKAAGRSGCFESAAPVEAAAWVGRVCEATLLAAPELARRLTQAGLEPLYRDVELPIAKRLARIERTGVCIDGEHFRRLGAEVGAQIAGFEEQVAELTGQRINLGSPKQLAQLLFEDLGLHSDRMRKTKTGYSTDHEVLESLIEAHPAVRLILEHRELTKLKGTYLDALPPLVNPRTGRVHTLFNQVAAATGRISSQDPNLQNIPIRSELGRAIRRGFVASPGRVLIAADYSQIELRILAHLSGDPVLTRAFRERVDVHTQTAAEVFGMAPAEVGARERRIAKAVNYGLVYGQSDFGLARALDISRREAHDYSQRYFERFPTIRTFMEEVVAQARVRGGSRTLLGRWRPIPDLKSKSPVARRAAERVAQNTPMQGSGADIIKLAMLRCLARIDGDGLPADLLLTVHDELVFECSPDHAEAVSAVVREEMEAAYSLDVPLDVDVGVAANWADA